LNLGLDSQRRSGFGVPAADAGRTINTVAVRLSVPIFAGGATQSQQRQAVLERDVQREQLEAARRALVRETQAQVLAVRLGIEQVDSSAAAVEAAERALAATRAGQSLGTRSMTDLLLAIQTHAQARNAHAQARHAYVLATLQLQAAVGQLGEPELARVNQLLQGAR
jgi:outer membrane protein